MTESPIGSGSPVRIVIIDDHEIVREGLAGLLALEPDFAVVASLGDGRAAVAECARLRPDLVLLDLRMPGMDGLEVLAALRARVPDCAVVMLSSHDGDDAIFRALQAGAAGYLLKKSRRAELAAAIRHAAAGTLRPSGEVAQRLAERATTTPLTPREIEVLVQVARGARNRQVAEALGISEETVKKYMNAILIKLDSKDRTEAVTRAVQRGIITLG